MDYKNIKKDNKCIAQYFKDLIINMQNDNTPKLELFYCNAIIMWSWHQT